MAQIKMTTTTKPKSGRPNAVLVRENRARRMAQRQGLMLNRANRKDKRARDYDCYRISQDGKFIFGDKDGWAVASLDDCEKFLLTDSGALTRAARSLIR